MKNAIRQKLSNLTDRFEEINALLSDAEIIQHNQKFRELSKEYTQLSPIIEQYRQYQYILQQQESLKILLQDPDNEVKALAETESGELHDQLSEIEKNLNILLIPRDEKDSANVFLEIRAAAGGDESAIFAGDLFRLYTKYAEKNRWQVEILQSNSGEHGGYKIIVARISGEEVYAKLKFESGAHRVQRVPETEAQGRVHTSTCTIAVMPEIDEIIDVDINPADLKVDTYRASGAGGQHVNKTDSAIRITHIPTGTVVECQDERSQHKNRARAMSLLKAKILDAELSKQQKQQAETRRNLVGTGDRSERIRTYNFPQGRLTDHRINLTLYKLDKIMEGDLEDIVEALRQEYQTDQLSHLIDE
jgi:peptide chain release factor 1